MRETIFVIVCFSLCAVSQIVGMFQSKLRWIYALSTVGIALSVIGTALRGYYHLFFAYYALAVPGLLLVGISAFMQVALIFLQVRAVGHLRREQ